MKYLINLFLFSFLVSCSLPTTKGFLENTLDKKEYQNLYFSNPNQDYVYKAKIKAFNNNFGGLLIIKKIKKDNHRIVFTTEFGNKLFDFEIKNGRFTTHYILKQLDRKILITTLQRDFETLTKEVNLIDNIFINNDTLIYKSDLKKRYNYYFLNSKTKRLQKITHTTKRKEKTIFNFQKTENNVAEKIFIEHKNLPITIELNTLKSF
jgi:hypothetical protein